MKLLLREEHKMSTNYTQNYSLCQWEPQDKVQRVDFNGDNAKIDAALTAQQAAIERAQSTAGAAYSPNNQPVVTGSYSGNGAARRDVSLGFRPRAVLVMPSNFVMNNSSTNLIAYGGLALNIASFSVGAYMGITITESGFTVFNQGENSALRTYLNENQRHYVYLAFR